MREKSIIIILILLTAYFLITIVNIIHETIHLIQARFNYEDVCFFGISGKKGGWVDSKYLTEHYTKDIEIQAYSGEIIISVLLSVILGYTIGGFVARCRNVGMPKMS
jgi:hypothetical protein